MYTTYTRVPISVAKEHSATAALIGGYLAGNQDTYQPCSSKVAEYLGMAISTTGRILASMSALGLAQRTVKGWAPTSALISAVDAGWLEVSTTIATRGDLTAEQKIIYSYLCSAADHSASAVTAGTGIPVRTAQRALDALCDIGMVHLASAGGGRGKCRHYQCGMTLLSKPQSELDEELAQAREEYAWQLSIGAKDIPADIMTTAVDALVSLETVPMFGAVRIHGEEVPAYKAFEYARLVSGYALTDTVERVKAAWNSVRDKQAYLLSVLLTEGRRVLIDVEGHDVPTIQRKAVVAV